MRRLRLAPLVVLAAILLTAIALYLYVDWPRRQLLNYLQGAGSAAITQLRWEGVGGEVKWEKPEDIRRFSAELATAHGRTSGYGSVIQTHYLTVRFGGGRSLMVAAYETDTGTLILAMPHEPMTEMFTRFDPVEYEMQMTPEDRRRLPNGHATQAE